MTKQDILKFANLNVRKVNAFGGIIEIRNLSIREMKEVTKLPEDEILAAMVSKAMVKPTMTKDELESLGIDALDDLTNIVNDLNGNGKTKDGSK